MIDKTEFKQAFSLLHASEDCLKEVKNMSINNNKSRGSRSLRISLIAACVCLALAVTGFAVAEHLGRVDMIRQQSSDSSASYSVRAELQQYELSELGAELQADLAAGTLRRVFNDKAELEAYLGIDLADAPELEAADIVGDLAEAFEYGFYLRPELAVDTTARYILSVTTLDGTEATEPQVLKISCHRVVDNTEVYMDARIVLGNVSMEELEQGLLGENFMPEPRMTHEWVKDENGEQVYDESGQPVVNTTQYRSADRAFTSSAYTMANGLEATVITAESIEPGWSGDPGALSGSSGAREYAGYFVHGGILYTVRPYAIDDPALDFPMLDSDSLIVLEHVLDMFE